MQLYYNIHNTNSRSTKKKYVFTRDTLQKKCFFTYALQYQANFQYI